MAFQFIDPGQLSDDEIELVTPRADLIPNYLAGADPNTHHADRHQIAEFIQSAPNGRQPGSNGFDRVPSYHFWIQVKPIPPGRVATVAKQKRSTSIWSHWSNVLHRRPSVVIVGGLGLRIGSGEDIVRNLGHVGYNIHPFARGHHYAERACRLIRGLALRHGIDPIWITCNPDNLASRRTCERLGATMVEIVSLPQGHSLRQRGEIEKCRYRWDLSA